MSLLLAYSQVLRDISKGRRVILVNLDSPDAALSITVLKSVLQESDCCSSVEATHTQCVARTKHGCLPQLAAVVLREYLQTQKGPATSSAPSVEAYIQRSPDTHEAESLACLLSDASASYVLEVFHSVHEPTAREGVHLLPADCTHVTLTDGRGSFLALLFARATPRQPAPTLSDLQALKSAAASCLNSFREVHPTAAVVLAAVYHDTFKLNLLEDSQPEALTLIQALQQTHQQLQPPPRALQAPSRTQPAPSASNRPQPGTSFPQDHHGSLDGRGRAGHGQGVRLRHQPDVDFWVAAGAAAAVAVGGVAMLVRQATKRSTRQSDS